MATEGQVQDSNSGMICIVHTFRHHILLQNRFAHGYGEEMYA